MPEFDVTTQGKIDDLRVLYLAGDILDVYELVKVSWPSPDGNIWYATTQVDVESGTAPDTDGDPIEVRLMTDDEVETFQQVSLDATIGDEEIELNFWDADEDISTKLDTHGEGIKCELYYWFPQVDLLLPLWQGHFEYGDSEDPKSIAIRAVQGFRSSDTLVPGGGHYPHCAATFGGLLTTQAAIDENACPYNLHIGGAIGIDDPATTDPWTYCDRRTTASCTARGVNPLYHLSHRTITRSVQNNQTSGPNLLSTSKGNETALEQPVRVVMGRRRIYSMQVMAFRRDLNNGTPANGWFLAYYEACRGPIRSMSQHRFKVGDQEKNADPYHLGATRLGLKGQAAQPNDAWQLTTHGYSLVAYARYNFGWIDPSKVDPGDAEGSCVIEGLNDIRVYTDSTTYTEVYSTNRAWQIARILCDKIWGYGLDYSRLNIDSFIEAAEWCEQMVRYTDPFDTDWDHIRSDSHPELIGRKVQQQIDDMCIAGRLSKPYLFNGQIHLTPLKALDAGELAAAPVFTDTGDSPNIIWEGEGDEAMTTLRITKRLSVKDLANRVECNFDDSVKDWQNVPLRPVEDEDAQLAAGRLLGDNTKKVNKKEYNLLGVTSEAQAIKLAWTLLDLGPCDEGGLRNNLPITFMVWFADALTLHQDKVIKVVSQKLTKYGFQYFRVKGITRSSNLLYEITAQAYNETYMDALEADITPIEPTYCTVDGDCPEGMICVDGVCVIEPFPCRPGFGTVEHQDGMLIIPIDPC